MNLRLLLLRVRAKREVIPARTLTVVFITSVCVMGLASFTVSAEEIPRTPEIVAERWHATGHTTARVSLFDNQVAVVSVREEGVRVFFRLTTLNAGDFNGFVAAISVNVGDIESLDSIEVPQSGDLDSGVRFMTASGEIDEIRYSSLSVIDLPVARLLATLNGVETLVRETLEGEEALKSWEARIGDVVELRAGGLAKVVDVREEGLIELEHLDVGIVEYVIFELRAQTILRVVPR